MSQQLTLSSLFSVIALASLALIAGNGLLIGGEAAGAIEQLSALTGSTSGQKG